MPVIQVCRKRGDSQLGLGNPQCRQPERLIGGTVTSHFLTAIFDQVASKPIVPKAAAWKAAALATELAIAMLAYPAYAALTTGGDTVQGLYDALLGTMKNGRSLGQSGRFARLEPVIRRSFDITTMARLSVGSAWATLSEAQRHQVVESFGRYISAIYAIVLTATPARNCKSPENSRLLAASW